MKKSYIFGTLITIILVAGCQFNRHTSPDDHQGGVSSVPGMLDQSLYGTPDDINYAQQLWQALVKAGMVGSEARAEEPFFGGARPHGMILELTSGAITVNQHTGFAIVKKNYDGEGVSVASVKRDRDHYLSSITVMFQREEHYDDDNQNWFWVKYQPDGSLFSKTDKGRTVELAGRLMKGRNPENNSGCIYCHSSAGGGDYIFYPSVSVPDIK